jgi:hypothetical protein
MSSIAFATSAVVHALSSLSVFTCWLYTFPLTWLQRGESEAVLKAMNNKQFVGGIFCDLRKAFDCVSSFMESVVSLVP